MGSLLWASAFVAWAGATCMSPPFRKVVRPGLVLVDRPSKLLLLSTPKAGATLGLQLFLRLFDRQRHHVFVK